MPKFEPRKQPLSKGQFERLLTKAAQPIAPPAKQQARAPRAPKT
mgnify:CR=1 FL=1